MDLDILVPIFTIRISYNLHLFIPPAKQISLTPKGDSNMNKMWLQKD